MTPLAMEIVKQMLHKPEQRNFVDQCGLLDRMDEIHCFEVTDIVPGVYAMLTNGVLPGAAGSPMILERVKAISEVTSFLPAPKTWIEYRTGNGRVGFLLEGHDDRFCVVRIAMHTNGHIAGSCPFHFSMGMTQENIRLWAPSTALPQEHSESIGNFISLIHGMLAFINTPRIIGRRQHMPHRGLEKRLMRERKNIGKFPLHAYTEILLHVTSPKDVSGEESTEAHYTGQRALHFCRAHLRIRMGKLEVVKAHWRGDPSLGIKRSRYKLAA